MSDRTFRAKPVEPLKRGLLPKNIRVTEFYFQPGGFLDSPLAQQSYMSSNYTHVVRDLLDARINVLAAHGAGFRVPPAFGNSAIGIEI